MRPDIEEAELEHGEKADRPGANDQYVGFDHIAHYYYSGGDGFSPAGAAW